jgi:hypothetical protein
MPAPGDEDDYFVCPHCGEELPVDAAFCRSCGASGQSGWNSEDAWSDAASGDADVDDSYSDADYEEEDFDYENFLAREFPDHVNGARRPKLMHWTLPALVALLLIILLLLGTIW